MYKGEINPAHRLCRNCQESCDKGYVIKSLYKLEIFNLYQIVKVDDEKWYASADAKRDLGEGYRVYWVSNFANSLRQCLNDCIDMIVYDGESCLDIKKIIDENLNATEELIREKAIKRFGDKTGFTTLQLRDYFIIKEVFEYFHIDDKYLSERFKAPSDSR